jgi:hypothetical protein
MKEHEDRGCHIMKSSTISAFTYDCYGDYINENKLGGSCGTHGREEICTQKGFTGNYKK